MLYLYLYFIILNYSGKAAHAYFCPRQSRTDNRRRKRQAYFKAVRIRNANLKIPGNYFLRAAFKALFICRSVDYELFRAKNKRSEK